MEEGGGQESPLLYFVFFMIRKETVKKIVDEFLMDSDNYPVDIQVSSDNVIIVEIDSDESVSIDDCVAVGKFIEAKLNKDVEDYELEVRSAGIGQPFKILRQYLKNVGNEVEVLTKTGLTHTGILKVANTDTFVLRVEKQVKPEGAKRKTTVKEDLTFTYGEIKHTKYLIRFK